MVSFDERNESMMLVQLTLTNEDAEPLLDARKVSLTIDDDANRNYLRRALPQVDLRKLAPGKSSTYSERFLAGAFSPGHYLFHLCISGPDSSRTVTSSNNLLLSSDGVPNLATGLNTVADFTVRKR